MSRRYKKSGLRKSKEKLVQHIKELGCCVDCQTKAALTFHHLEPDEKIATIPQLIRDEDVSVLFLRNEIAKCILLCRTCHDLRHAETRHALVLQTRNHA